MNFQMIETYVKNKLSKDATGHDWLHIKRVLKNAKEIYSQMDLSRDQIQIIQIACLVHDLIDYKLVEDIEGERNKLKNLLALAALSQDQIDQVFDIIDNMSFSSNLDSKKDLTLEGQIVQDADRLDAIGAIGIARTFYYGGSRQSKMYDEAFERKLIKKTENQYKNQSSVIEHFYEKLLHLKDLMNTDPAKKIAESRHKIMEDFLDYFFEEI